jgi:hypothetical protein
MGKWIALFVFIISSSVLAYLYVELQSVSSETLPIVPIVNSRTLRVFHSYESGEHRYMSEIKLPHSCYELDIQDTRPDPKDLTKHTIVVKGIDRMLDLRLCVKISTRYQFDILIPAPENITTSLLVNGVPTPIRIVETPWQSPQGKSLTTPDQSQP